jgi:asparagine synthase (glutamine-hydrolysing)
MRTHVRRAIEALPGCAGRYGRRTFLALEPGVRDLYLENFSVVPLALQRSLLRNPDTLRDADPYAEEARCYEEAGGSVLDRISRTDLQSYLHELLMKQDQMSMAASIESRVPFLDDRLVEHVIAIPAHIKLPGWRTKTLLREAVRDLVPSSILTRRKMGFPVPLGRWFRDGFTHVIDEFVLGSRTQARGLFQHAALRQLVDEHLAGRAAHADRLWLLANLEIWLRIFHDGEQPAEVARLMRRGAAPEHLHANPLGENGRPLAVDDGWARPKPADPVAAFHAPLHHAGHDARP